MIGLQEPQIVMEARALLNHLQTQKMNQLSISSTFGSPDPDGKLMNALREFIASYGLGQQFMAMQG